MSFKCILRTKEKTLAAIGWGRGAEGRVIELNIHYVLYLLSLIPLSVISLHSHCSCIHLYLLQYIFILAKKNQYFRSVVCLPYKLKCIGPYGYIQRGAIP